MRAAISFSQSPTHPHPSMYVLRMEHFRNEETKETAIKATHYTVFHVEFKHRESSKAISAEYNF